MANIGLSANQIEARRGKVMASDVAAYLGCNPQTSPVEAWGRNLGYEEFADNEFTEMGLFLEEALTQLAVQRLGVGAYSQPGTLFHPRHTWAGCTPDALLPALAGHERSGIQIKNRHWSQLRFYGENPGPPADWPDDANHADLIPEWDHLQVQWEMFVIGASVWHLAAFFGGADFRIYRVRRDTDLQALMLKRLAEFWRLHLDSAGPQETPGLDGHPGTTKYLRRHYPRDAQPDLLPTTPALVEHAQRASELAARIKELERAEAEARQHLMQACGEAPGIAGLCTWKCNRPSRKTDWQALAKSLPGWEQALPTHTAETPGARVFRLTYKPE